MTMQSLLDHETINDETHIQKKKKNQKRLQVKNGKMNMTQARNCQFARLSDKSYYFSDGVV